MWLYDQSDVLNHFYASLNGPDLTFDLRPSP